MGKIEISVGALFVIFLIVFIALIKWTVEGILLLL